MNVNWLPIGFILAHVQYIYFLPTNINTVVVIISSFYTFSVDSPKTREVVALPFYRNMQRILMVAFCLACRNYGGWDDDTNCCGQ